jgi:FdhE protein
VSHRHRPSAAAGLEAGRARAEKLARDCPPARELLRFAAGLLHAQAGAAGELSDLHAARPLAGHLAQDLERVLGPLCAVPRFAAEQGPPPLAEAARDRLAEGEHMARARLRVCWDGNRDYLGRAMLRPYAEVLRAHALAPGRARARGRCPFCGGAPGVGCRRGGGEGNGAARFLACAQCGLEWAFNRILCPACLEADPHKLPAFTSDAFPAVRIEACETCRRYVKSLDLSQDARAVPEVDDLASLALDLWAVEQAFARLEPGLAGG